ncbi:MAG: hypothetical protein KJ655_03485 [Candidatus Thermoplasmatota archaeon]|nr:hypothetical protein [Candidatus Thermoplasmatota archaeon]
MEATHVWIILTIVLTLIFIIGFFAISFWYKRVRRPFRETASELSLEYKKGSPSSLMPAKVTGTYRGHSLNIYVESRTSGHPYPSSMAETSVSIEVTHSGIIRKDMYIFRKGFKITLPLSYDSDVDSTWFVKTKYISGIPEFDRRFRVKGDKDIMGNILDLSIIQKILDIKKIDFIKIKSRKIILKRWGSFVDKEYLIKGIDIAVDLAEKVERISAP